MKNRKQFLYFMLLFCFMSDCFFLFYHMHGLFVRSLLTVDMKNVFRSFPSFAAVKMVVVSLFKLLPLRFTQMLLNLHSNFII